VPWINLSFNFGAVLTSSQMTQLDDNFEAQAAGDAGAPIQSVAGGGTGANVPSSARTNLGLGDISVLDTITELNVSASVTGSSYRIAFNPATEQTTPQVFTVMPLCTVVVPRSGTYQVTFEMRGGSVQGSVQARFYRNEAPTYSGDVALGVVQSEGDGQWVKKVEGGIALGAGDVLTMYGNRFTNPAQSWVETRNLTLESDTKLLGGT